jgi:hypothetical protein
MNAITPFTCEHDNPEAAEKLGEGTCIGVAVTRQGEQLVIIWENLNKVSFEFAQHVTVSSIIGVDDDEDENDEDDELEEMESLGEEVVSEVVEPENEFNDGEAINDDNWEDGVSENTNEPISVKESAAQS